MQLLSAQSVAEMHANESLMQCRCVTGQFIGPCILGTAQMELA